MNNSGITPVEYNVLIKQDDVTEKTSGGVIMPDDYRDRQEHGSTKGVIVAVSPMAFNFEDWPTDQPKPSEGQRVVFGRHCGAFVEGNDGERYRVVKDKDVIAVIENE